MSCPPAESGERLQSPRSRGPVRRARMVRVGLRHRGRLVQDRLVPAHEDVWLGSDPRCVLSLPDSWFPAGFPSRVLLLRGGPVAPVLVATEHLRGAVQRAGRRETLQVAEKAPGEGIAMEPGTRAVLRAGPCVVLVQLVEVERGAGHALPGTRAGTFRPRLTDPDDPVFLGMLGLWTTAAALLMGWVFARGPVEGATLAELPDEVVRLVMRLPATPATPVTPVAPEPLPVAEEAPPDPVEPEPALMPVEAVAKTPQEQQENEALGRERARQEVVRQSALLGMLAKGFEGDAVFRAGDGLGALRSDLAGIEAPALAGRAPGVRGPAGGRGLQDAGIGGPERGPAGAAVVAEARLRAPASVRAAPTGPPGAPGSARQLQADLRPQLGRMKRCYERELARDPGLAGRVVLTVEVAGGAVVEAMVVDDGVGSDGLASCLVDTARRMRFSEQTEGEVRLPLVFSPAG